MKKLLIIFLCLPFIVFCQFTDNFSDGNFTNNPIWMGDVGNFEVDSNNILHLNDSIANTSSLVTSSSAVANSEWVFNVRLDFPPSGNNYAKVYLVSDMIDLSSPLNGMYVRIGQAGSADGVSLYTQNGTNSNEIIDGTDSLIANNPDIRVKVTRDSVGNWELFLDTNGIFFTQGTAFDNSVTSSDYFGVFCKYTITRSKKFWFDDINVSSSAAIVSKTYIPDDNFENYLEANGMGDGIPLNDSVFISAIDTVLVLDIQSQNISDLTGIEDFTALTYFVCESNNITNLYISQNSNLTHLKARYNQLTSLDISNNIALTYLECDYNQITNLNVSNNIALTSLSCAANQLSTLNVSNNTSLIELDCYDNYLTSLDVSNNINLIALQNRGNQITSLDLSNNTALTEIDCGDNQLTILDVSNNSALVTLDCYSNQIATLDITQNIALTWLDCHSNQLVFLDLRNGNNTAIGTDFYATNNPDLTCINVDDVSFSNTNWTDIDPQHFFSNNCTGTSVEEYITKKDLLKVTDLLGRETKNTNQPLFYIYNNGIVEKRIVIE
ncbi:MAG: hypothetical protein CMD16_03675 [Flavobacteriales bacterium]|nr:hypothetical protein [Flavobacteriales bacterium]|tara:strand:+ start:3809 stop:5467 length:1659 start_codon:yes stop_codon:yes gene_type:complete